MAQVKMKIIIDVQGLIDFYKDDFNANWGTIKENPCKADSFCNFIASNSTFAGSSGSIHIWKQDRIYTWEIHSLNNETIYLSIDGDENKIIMGMVQKLEGNVYPKQIDWEKLFVWNDDYLSVNEETGELQISERDKEHESYIFEITTKKIIDKVYNLTYSIRFSFLDGSTTRYGIIDPFISVRSDDPE